MTKRTLVQSFAERRCLVKAVKRGLSVCSFRAGRKKDFSVEPPRDSRVRAKELVDSEGQQSCNLSGTAGLIFRARLKENLWDGLFTS